MSETLSYAVDDGVATISFDDGKANVLTHDVIAEFGELLDRAGADARAVAIVGRPGRFSAGFDLSVMQAGPQQARDLLLAGAELGLRIFESPIPVVLGCTGHALAMGSILLMTADVRVGTEGEFKIGLNEVAIGMPVPKFAVEIARDRLSKRHFTSAVNHAHIYTPLEAVDVGYLDEVAIADELEDVVRLRAHHLATTLNVGAFQLTRRYCRAGLAEQLRSSIEEDMALFNVA